MERGNKIRWHNVSSLNGPRWPKVVARWLAVWNFGLELEVTLTRDSTSLLHLVLLMVSKLCLASYCLYTCNAFAFIKLKF